jgi:drug/metabolite transporter (DMT)-like permease
MSSHNHAALPEGRDIALLSLGVVGIGTSGPLIALSAMPIPSLIFWRNLGGAISMLPFAIGRREWKSSEQRAALRWSAISGVILAFHFIGFFLAMRLTSVAAGTALTAMQPIFTAIFLRIRGAQIPRKAWLGMFVAFISVLSITGVDWQISFRSFTGDMAAIVGAALAAIYMLIGSKAQRILSTSTYTTVCYGICAFTSLPIALIIGYPVVGFALKQWLIVIGLVVGAQLL